MRLLDYLFDFALSSSCSNSKKKEERFIGDLDIIKQTKNEVAFSSLRLFINCSNTVTYMYFGTQKLPGDGLRESDIFHFFENLVMFMKTEESEHFRKVFISSF